ncbi:hypothetical protein IFM89_022613 [Coptis chinensis]|uniref:Uncharacterized protein n=1 Tax=Coptis chinensis TaxID=261450 RepID=A0A835ICI0_9MAGN|nr:hypothetical protein IFM89_022613 [Coptis chinensis]
MQEWEILEKNLPESMLVRVYGDRIDLLRAVTIGSELGTPYYKSTKGSSSLISASPAGTTQHGLLPFTITLLAYVNLNFDLSTTGEVRLPLLKNQHPSKEGEWNASKSTLESAMLWLKDSFSSKGGASVEEFTAVLMSKPSAKPILERMQKD